MNRRVMLSFALALVCALHALGGAGVAASNLYCGEKDCYDLLEVSKTATSSEIKKAFYKVSLQLYVWCLLCCTTLLSAHSAVARRCSHPDKNKAPNAESMYRDVVNAYEVLSDAVSRANYDDMLANPDRFFTNQFQYYQYRAGLHQIALWKVVSGFLFVLTVLHYLYWTHRYHQLHRLVKGHHQVQIRMRQAVIAAHPELNPNSDDDKPKIAKLVEAEDIRNYVAISGWEVLPGWKDLLVFSLVFRYPVNIARYLWWHVRWFWKFTVNKEAYGDDERSYVTSVTLRIDWGRWMAMPDDERNKLIARELWKPANWKEFVREHRSAMKKKW